MVTTYYLNLVPAASVNLKPAPDSVTVIEALKQNYRFNRYLYQLVGEPWQWTDKLEWSDDQWAEYAHRTCLRTWYVLCEGSIAGYFELERHDDSRIEINYFGLAPDFLESGAGGYLLSEAITQAKGWNPSAEITVNTCTLDHPYALANYQSRGFQIVRTEQS